MLKLLSRIIVACIIILFSSDVKASEEANVTVTATGLVVQSPTGFVIVYVDDAHVQGFWSVPSGVDMVELRYKVKEYPIDRNDGIQVYSGNLTSALMYVDLASSSPLYFRIWSRNASTGVWETKGAFAKGDFMSQSWTWMILLIYALGVTTIPIMLKVFFGNPATKTLYALAAVSAWLAFMVFPNESHEVGFVFSFDPTWAKLDLLSIFALVGGIVTASIGTTIDKSSGTHIWKNGDKRSRSQRVSEDYSKALRTKLYGGKQKMLLPPRPKIRY